jgi:6-phosphogluconolactonase
MIEVFADADSLCQAATDLFAELATRAVEARGRFSVSLSGGQTPRRLYEILAQPPHRDQVPWERVHIFWGDERHVPPDDVRSNARMARTALLDHVPIPPAQIHPVPFAPTAREAAQRYEAALRAFFGGHAPQFDLVLLGLGENGHTASLFPHTEVLDEQTRWVAEVYVKEQDLWRVTMTAPLLNQAAVAAFLVEGKNKADVLRQVLKGKLEPARLPAQLIRPVRGELRWLVDRAAAARLDADGPGC